MAKRPHYSVKVIKDLFGTSDNTCQFSDAHVPSCEKTLTDPSWKKVRAHIAHICGFQPSAERHEETMTDQERNGFDNLILLCPNHHQLIDELEPERFTVDVLREMKRKALSRETNWKPTDAQLTDFATQAINYAVRFARVYDEPYPSVVEGEGEVAISANIEATAQVFATAHDATVETIEPDSIISAFLRNHFDQGGAQLRPPQVAEGTELDLSTVQLSLGRLHRAGQVQGITVEEEDYPVIITGVFGS
jgi:hypothetical protein